MHARSGSERAWWVWLNEQRGDTLACSETIGMRPLVICIWYSMGFGL